MAQSPLILANRSLSLLSQVEIASLTELSDTAKTSNVLFDQINEQVQSAYHWRFNTGKSQLGRLTAVPGNEWDYAFQLPSDMIDGPLAVFNSGDTGIPTTNRFEIFQDKLYSNDLEIWIDYQFIAHFGLIPTYIDTLIVLALTGAIAPAITEKPALASEYNERAWGTAAQKFRGGWCGVCITKNDQSNPTNKIEDFSLISARF